MQIFTIKAKPKVIFGCALAITGLIVILLTFTSNHSTSPSEQTMAKINCSTTQERTKYLTSLGWEFGSDEREKEITIPNEFNDIYQSYNEIQKNQGFNLEEYKGKKATLYTYDITNCESSDKAIADLIVIDGVLVGADLCDPSAENGFLVALDGK